ncbi:uncharacterized protein PHACADRAFT_98180 [Phanerochaete carnosa HHB-10118-sp]|uniref:SET domain-containing protein n=1 Tax=Phanerochaete carnosa (strain HHB-10118-sp) TaxID=650164 RepID=K5WVC7_PHACS|nr:uncharacterized protein PHACADRAFT_98180 [Phanerochaete carnosa HHB-10118-sp]EKM54377.1 hypothetical protein PHACADRAFT_98180 [Phanerochaete carnosa HHB-10118-sp]
MYDEFGRTYLFDIDSWHLKQPPWWDGKPEDWQTKYCVDAFHAGNFTRFLNHSCDPNCIIVPAYINEANIDKPLLTIWTNKSVAAGEELCFSYVGDPEDLPPLVSHTGYHGVIAQYMLTSSPDEERTPTSASNSFYLPMWH